MAENEIYAQMAQNLKEAEPKIKEAEEVIRLAKNAGENTSSQESKLMTLKNRVNRWKSALKTAGYTV